LAFAGKKVSQIVYVRESVVMPGWAVLQVLFVFGLKFHSDMRIVSGAGFEWGCHPGSAIALIATKEARE